MLDSVWIFMDANRGSLGKGSTWRLVVSGFTAILSVDLGLSFHENMEIE